MRNTMHNRGKKVYCKIQQIYNGLKKWKLLLLAGVSFRPGRTSIESSKLCEEDVEPMTGLVKGLYEKLRVLHGANPVSG